MAKAEVIKEKIGKVKVKLNGLIKGKEEKKPNTLEVRAVRKKVKRLQRRYRLLTAKKSSKAKEAAEAKK